MSVAMTLRSLVCLLPLAVACSDPPPPIEVANGRLVARIYPDPARIALVLDGKEVWTTRGDSGDSDGAPNGFAAVGNRATTIEHQFGSFKFVENENNESWQSITTLGDITEKFIRETNGAFVARIHQVSALELGEVRFHRGGGGDQRAGDWELVVADAFTGEVSLRLFLASIEDQFIGFDWDGEWAVLSRGQGLPVLGVYTAKPSTSPFDVCGADGLLTGIVTLVVS